MIMFIK